MQLGTATIANEGRFLKVTYMNHGNFLRNEPRYFETVKDAEKWCRERSLRVIYKSASVEGDMTGTV